MKPAKLTTSLLIVLALVSFGCASASPTASTNPASSPELEQAQITKKPNQENYVEWSLLYALLEVGGTCLSGR
jgi:hypothetical protein